MKRQLVLEFSQQVQRQAGGFVQSEFSEATLHLVINLVTSTILQLVLDPPKNVSPEALQDELVLRVEDWIRGRQKSGRNALSAPESAAPAPSSRPAVRRGRGTSGA